MGVSKAELPFGPERMLQRVVRLLASVVDPIVVVAAATQRIDDLPVKVIIARDEREARGPLEGLQAGLRALASGVPVAFATSCDVPLLQPAVVQALAERLGNYDAVVPVESEFVHPLAAVYRTSVLSHIEALLAEDRLRPMFLFDRVKTLRVPVEELRAVDPQLGTLRNLNRPEEYLAALQEAGFAPEPAILAALGRPRTDGVNP